MDYKEIKNLKIVLFVVISRIAKVYNERLSAGGNEVIIPLEKSGLYFYSIEAGNIVAKRGKIIIN